MGQAIRKWNGGTSSIPNSTGGIVYIQSLNSSTYFNGNIIGSCVNHEFSFSDATPVIAKF